MTCPHDLTVSWSGLRAHEECRQRTKLVRAGHRSPVQDLRNFYHGMVVDQIMRRWLADPLHPPGGMQTMVDTYIDAEAERAQAAGEGIVRWRHAGDKDDVRQFCVELCERLEPILRDLILPHVSYTARRFRVPMTVPYLDGTPTTITLIGEIDLLVARADGERMIWDLKATRDDSYYRKVMGQLCFYDVAINAVHGKSPVTAGLIQPMCAEPVLEFAFTEDDRRQLLARVLRMVDDIWRDNAPLTTATSRCPKCDVRHACPRFTSLASSLRSAAQESR